MIRLIGMLMLALKAWMLHDAYRRRVDGFWYFVIVGVPGGSLIYFVAVRAQDSDARAILAKVGSLFRGPPRLEDLQAVFEDSPSHHNRLQLAQALFDHRHTAEARVHFDAMRDDDPDVLLGRGLCALELGDHEGALPPLQTLVDLKPGHREFAAFPVLARALWGSDRTDQCLELLRRFARREPLLPHVVLLARYLDKAGDGDQARAELQSALKQHDRAPRHVRKQYGHWAGKARNLLRELEARSMQPSGGRTTQC